MGGVRVRSLRVVGATVALAALGWMTMACAASGVFHEGERAGELGDWDHAVLSFAKASAMEPKSERYQIALLEARLKSSRVHFEKAKRYMMSKQLELAIGELQQTTYLDPTNEFAATELEKALIEWQKEREEANSKSEMEVMKDRAKNDRGVPKLNPASNIPIILKFQQTEIGKIYEALSKASGINFLYDSKLDLKKKIDIDLTNVSFEDAMNTLMLINKHFFKVIDENTILLADDTQQKRREIEDEVIKTFFLSNADVKDVQTLLRTLLDARKIVQNNQLNAITIRDTPNRVAIAQRIIEANDKSKAELVVDIELMEISRTISRTLGINLTPQRYTIQYTGPTSLPLNNLGLLKQVGSYALGPIPQVTLDFLKSDSGTKVVAKPELRVTEGEKANLHLGDSVPIPTTTFNTAGTVGGNVVPITSFTYQEVGIVIEIEPRVHHNREVTLKLNVEVSQLGDQVSTGNGQSSPSINTRQINTVIRLKDGETNLLAGLIRDDGTEGRSGFPGLIDAPFLRRIFSSQTSTHRETDLILTLTPHIIRNPDIREEDLQALFIGTEGNPHLRGQGTSAFGPNPFAGKEGAAEEEEAEEEPEPAADAGAAAKPPTEKPAAKPPEPKSGEPVKVEGPKAPAPAAVETKTPPRPAVRPGEAPPTFAPGVEYTPPAPSAKPPNDEDLESPEPVDEEDTGAGTPAPTPAVPPSGGVAPPASGQPAPPEAEPPAPITPITLALAPGRITVAGGGGFAFNVMVAGATDLQVLNIVLKYDPAVADFDQALEGIFMRSDGTQTSFSAQKAAEGTVNLEIRRVNGPKGVTGSGSAAAIRFRPIAAGRTLVNVIKATATDSAGRSIPVNPSGADVTVSQ
jgi:general secretion pathway protein D